MALFRKRLSLPEMQGVVIDLFISRMPPFFGQLSHGLRRIGIDADNVIYDEDRLRVFQDFWVISALKLSIKRHRQEPANISNKILHNLSGYGLNNLTIQRVDEIINIFFDDKNLFHNVSWHLVQGIYPEIEGSISPFNSIENDDGTFQISGMELASCLRGMDFILKDYKI